jgi:hypothetical protein
MSRAGAPPTVPAARRDQAPSITGPEAALEGALGGIYGGRSCRSCVWRRAGRESSTIWSLRS